jgi:hypothetical protein
MMSSLVDEVRKLFRQNNSLVLSTVSAKGTPQSSLVVYVSDGETLYIMTGLETQKVKNISKNPLVSVTIPYYKNILHRIITRAPPASLTFKADADFLPFGSDEPRKLFKKRMGMETPDMPNARPVWIRLRPRSRVTCLGVGVPLWQLRNLEKSHKIVKL